MCKLLLCLFLALNVNFVCLEVLLTHLNDDDEHVLEKSNSYSEAIIMDSGFSLSVSLKKAHIDTDGILPDYLLIKRGKSAGDDGTGITVVSLINKDHKYIIHHHEVFINFVADSHNSSFKLIYQRIGTRLSTTTQIPEATTLFPKPSLNDSILATVFVSGKSDKTFYNETNIFYFREAVSKMAIEYCDTNMIARNATITYMNVEIHELKRCSYSWPNSENCVEIVFALPILPANGNEYELKSGHLKLLWLRYANKYLGLHQFEVYETPDPSKVIVNWYLIIGLIIAGVIMIIVLPIVWRNITRKYFNRSQSRFSDTQKIINRKISAESMAPDRHQVVPNMYDDEDEINNTHHRFSNSFANSAYSDDETNHYSATMKISHDNSAYASTDL